MAVAIEIGSTACSLTGVAPATLTMAAASKWGDWTVGPAAK
jgi:hypothetical protein